MSNYENSTILEKFHSNLNNLASNPELPNNNKSNNLNYNETAAANTEHLHQSNKINTLFTPTSKSANNYTYKTPNVHTQSILAKPLDEPMFDVSVTGVKAKTHNNGFKPNLTSSPAGNCGWNTSNEQMPSSSPSSPHFLTNSQDRNNLLSPIINSDTNSKIPVFTIGLDENSESSLMRSSGNLLSPPDQDVNHNKTCGHHRSSSSPISSSSFVNTGNEESFECYADGSQSFFDSNSENTSLQYSRDSNNDLSVPEIFGGTNTNSSSGVSSLPGFKRNAVFRTSLRRSPQNNPDTMGHRRWGSFRNPSGVKRSFQPPNSSTGGPIVVNSSTNSIGNQLYRSSSFHSSGRSSAGDGEEIYSDGSLEDEVIDLKQTVHHLEEKFNVLSDNQSEVDVRYARSKQENIELSTKLFMLEEQLRDVEHRSEERVREEQKRSKESIQRLDREKQLQIENYEIRLQSMEKELETHKAEAQRAKLLLEREKSERVQIADKLYETERELAYARDDNRKLMESARSEREALALETMGSQQALLDLKREVENLRQFQMTKSIHKVSENTDGDFNESRVKELEAENRRLKATIKQLEEANEDLTAQILNHGLEEGRNLLTMNHFGGNGMENSIAAEFEAMSQDEQHYYDGVLESSFSINSGAEINQVKRALKEQKEVNEQLKAYIDGILLNIVENYPQLLEVKNKCSLPDSTTGPNTPETMIKST